MRQANGLLGQGNALSPLYIENDELNLISDTFIRQFDHAKSRKKVI